MTLPLPAHFTISVSAMLPESCTVHHAAPLSCLCCHELTHRNKTETVWQKIHRSLRICYICRKQPNINTCFSPTRSLSSPATTLSQGANNTFQYIPKAFKSCQQNEGPNPGCFERSIRSCSRRTHYVQRKKIQLQQTLTPSLLTHQRAIRMSPTSSTISPSRPMESCSSAMTAS